MKTETLDEPVQVAALNRTDESPDINSKLALTARLQCGQFTWTGPMVVVVARSAFIVLAQAVTVLWLRLRFHSGSWNAAAKWWTVYGTLVDLGCLALIASFLRARVFDCVI